jgi:hypothetical protein
VIITRNYRLRDGDVSKEIDGVRSVARMVDCVDSRTITPSRNRTYVDIFGTGTFSMD